MEQGPHAELSPSILSFWGCASVSGAQVLTALHPPQAEHDKRMQMSKSGVGGRLRERTRQKYDSSPSHLFLPGFLDSIYEHYILNEFLKKEMRSWQTTLLSVENTATTNTNWFYDMTEEK